MAFFVAAVHAARAENLAEALLRVRPEFEEELLKTVSS